MEALREALRSSRAPGVAVAAVRRKEVVVLEGHGVTARASSGARDDTEKSFSVCPESTVFLTASISKTFVAVLALQAAERGELDLDGDINKVLDHGPRPLHVENPHFPGSVITPRQLLRHESGLVDDESALLPRSIFRCEGLSDHGMTLDDYVRCRLVPGGEHYSSGLWNRSAERSSYHYSNAGFTLLGLLLERASPAGKSLDVLARENVFQRIGMQRTFWKMSSAPSFGGEDARGGLARSNTAEYTLARPHEDSALAIEHFCVAEWPAAQVRSTALDLCRYLIEFTSTASGEGNRLLNAKSLQEMFPADSLGGLAWWGNDAPYHHRDKQERVWMHGGFMQGTRTHIFFWPDRQEGAVILTNGDGDYGKIEQTLIAILRERANLEKK